MFHYTQEPKYMYTYERSKYVLKIYLRYNFDNFLRKCAVEVIYGHFQRRTDDFFSSPLLPHLGACSRFWSIGLSFLSFLIRDSR
jgi:hypothetical protein